MYLLLGMQMLVTAWDAVTTKTVVNRFGMSKILNESQKAIVVEEDDSFEEMKEEIENQPSRQLHFQS